MKSANLRPHPLPFVATALLALAAVIANPLPAAALISDSFAPDSHLVQDLPNQKSAWYFSYGAETIDDAGNGALTLNTGAAEGIQSVVTYFSDTPVSLANTGDSLSVSLKFSVMRTGDGQLRFSLFNSGGNRVAADGHGSFDSNFNAYRGYTAYADVRFESWAPVNPLELRLRTTDNHTLVNTGSHAGTTDVHGNPIPSGGAQSSSNTFANNIDYMLTYSITRISDATVSITMSITGGDLTGYSFTWTEIAGGFASAGLDTFAISLGNNGTLSGLTLKEAEITFAPAIPEPSAVAALAGAVALALGSTLRRRTLG